MIKDSYLNSIRGYPDGKLLWIVHFDRNNYQQKFLEGCEAELDRRGVSLHKIDESYLKTIDSKVVEKEVDIWSFAPRDPIRWWYLIPFALGNSLAEIWFEQYTYGWIAFGLACLVFILLESNIDPRHANKLIRRLTWISIITINAILLCLEILYSPHDR